MEEKNTMDGYHTPHSLSVDNFRSVNGPHINSMASIPNSTSYPNSLRSYNTIKSTDSAGFQHSTTRATFAH